MPLSKFSNPLAFTPEVRSVSTENVFIQKEPWWVQVIKQLGLPTLLLLLGIFGAYQAASWFGREVIVPLSDRQIKFIDQVEDSVQKITAIIEEHQRNAAVIAKELDTLNKGISDLNEKTKQNGDKLQSIEEVLNKGN